MTHNWIEIKNGVYQCANCGMVIAAPVGQTPQWDKLPSCSNTPRLSQRAWNYAQAFVRWSTAGYPIRTQAEQEDILAICRQCEYYNADSQQCRLCGCFLRSGSILLSKVAWSTEHCPIGKW